MPTWYRQRLCEPSPHESSQKQPLHELDENKLRRNTRVENDGLVVTKHISSVDDRDTKHPELVAQRLDQFNRDFASEGGSFDRVLALALPYHGSLVQENNNPCVRAPGDQIANGQHRRQHSARARSEQVMQEAMPTKWTQQNNSASCCSSLKQQLAVASMRRRCTLLESRRLAKLKGPGIVASITSVGIPAAPDASPVAPVVASIGPVASTVHAAPALAPESAGHCSSSRQ
jgi:hypothetical protein